VNYLLDTHVFLWVVGDAERIKPEAADAIRNPHNVVLVSAVTGVEIAIKSAMGKLKAPGDLEDEIGLRGFSHLPLTYEHGSQIKTLPMNHQDPFDRLLIAQARQEELTLITHDRKFTPYEVDILWT